MLPVPARGVHRWRHVRSLPSSARTLPGALKEEEVKEEAEEEVKEEEEEKEEEHQESGEALG